MRAFGVPVAWTPIVALMVPLAELACAGALLSAGLVWWGAAGASALLAAFIAGVAGNLALGRRPDCRCFGQLHSSPAGWPTLARNAALVAIAAYVAVRVGDTRQPGVVAAWRALTAGHGALPVGIAGLVVAWLVAGIWLFRSMSPAEDVPAPRREVARGPRPVAAATAAAAPPPAVEEREAWVPRELPEGAEAPAFELEHVDGHMSSLHALGAGGTPLLLVFTQPHCPACEAVLPDAAGWQQTHADRLVVVAIGLHTDDADAVREKAKRHGLRHVLFERGDVIGAAYGIEQLPTAVLVADGRIASRLEVGRDAIRALVARATQAPDEAATARLPASESGPR
jgi:peroxiredoxin